MTKRRILSLLLIMVNIATSLTLTGCGKEASTTTVTETVLKEGEYQIYYLNKSKTALQSKVIEYKDSEDVVDIATECMEYMCDAMSKEIVDGSVVLDVQDYRISNGILTVDLDEEYYDIDSTSEILVRACMVLTLTQIKGVEYVGITVEGQTIKDGQGNTINKMKADEFVNFKDNFPYTKKEVTLVLYFADADAKMLRTKKIDTYYDYSVSYEQFVINHLIAGVTEKDVENGYKSTLPKGTVLDLVYTKDGVCYVDFDQSFMDTVRPVSTELLLYSIINSLTESSYVTKVQFSVEGESNIELYNEVDLSEPFSRNVDLILKESENN